MSGFTKEQWDSLNKIINPQRSHALSASTTEQKPTLHTIEAEIAADVIAAMNANINAKFNEIIRLLRQRQGLPPAPPVALPALPPAPPQASPPAQKPCASTPPELPPQPSTPVTARSYPPSPSVEAIEKVEQKQVYNPLRNLRKKLISKKHGASKKMAASQLLP